MDRDGKSDLGARGNCHVGNVLHGSSRVVSAALVGSLHRVEICESRTLRTFVHAGNLFSQMLHFHATGQPHIADRLIREVDVILRGE